jgi:hypothetical protein
MLAFVATAHAQRKPQLDFSLSYVAEHANPVGPGGNFWLQGGSAELGVNAWRGLGIAAKVTGTHTNSFGPNAIPLSLLTTTFGPRYRYTLRSKGKQVSVFGEGLIGEGHGIGSIFPSTTGITNYALSFASEVGGGVDLDLSRRFAVRAVQASWARTQLPNSTTNVQNDLRLGAGLVVKF